MRQYIRMIDYSMWDVILESDQLPKTADDGNMYPLKLLKTKLKEDWRSILFS